MVEHIALELSEPAGIGVTYGKSIYGDSPGIYKVIVRALDGVNAVAVGLILGSAVVLYTNLSFHWINSVVMIAAFLLLDKVKMKVPPLVLLALLCGFVYHYLQSAV
jgi:chromate transport protein ChrA